jgi:predicted nucleic acid-binding protein
VRALENPVVCAIARVEVPAAIWRKQRLGELAPADAAVLVEQFEWEWHGDAATEPLFAVVAVGEAVLESAALACARHGLRAYDAVQLAAALLARDADASLTSFACFDRELAGAAAQERFSTGF